MIRNNKIKRVKSKKPCRCSCRYFKTRCCHLLSVKGKV
ncbi:SWIM zinc finger family protein [Desulfosporosinus burensis]